MKNDNVRNFFYNKNGGKTPRKNCFWMQYGNKKYLISYQTVVASIDDRGKFEKYWNDYSATTQNQINQFIRLFDRFSVTRSDTGEIINYIGKKEWLDMETSILDEETIRYIQDYIPEIIWSNNYYNDYVEKIIYDWNGGK